MAYIDLDRLEAIDPATFRRTKPYPWANPPRLLHEEAYRWLVETLPDVSLFTPHFGKQRSYGQRSHDRYVLECDDRIELAEPWREFIDELRQRPYRRFLERLLGVRRIALRFHWLYTPSGCSVSPHCDGRNEIGTHIFYFNPEEEWEPSWGGSTLVLDDGGSLAIESAPWFDSFRFATPANSAGNNSLVFARTDHSWHGVEELACPEHQMRRIFSVIVGRNRWTDRLARFGERSNKTYY